MIARICAEVCIGFLAGFFIAALFRDVIGVQGQALWWFSIPSAIALSWSIVALLGVTPP